MPTASSGPAFAPGDMVAERYRIVRFLAQGGMGEVYDAEDLELRQAVALKTVGAQMGDEPVAVERFKREIALARRVTHPNVCRIFDLGTHQSPAGPVAFLSMELLRGETLSALLKRRGRLEPDEALPLVRQMADALAAAHAARVVHRDFKSENVYLVPGEGGDTVEDPSTARVVVTDFGVARGAAGDAFAAQVTGLGIVGTPSYMAPEQVENAPEITAAADLYALGVVLYEMTTGRLPFESDNPLTVAVKRLKEDPRPPHAHAPDLPAKWEKVILRCLARRPEDRFATVHDVVAALEAEPVRPNPVGSNDVTRARPAPVSAPASTPARAPAPAPTPAGSIAASAASKDEESPGRTRLLAALLVLVALLAGGLWWLNQGVLEGRVKIRPSVAVLGFDNVTGREDAAWIDTAVAEMLATELSRAEGLRTVPRERVASARREIEIPRLAEPGTTALGRVREILGTDYVVSGSYVALPDEGGELRLDLHLFDAALGQTVESYAESGPRGELFAMVSRLGESLRRSLDAGTVASDAGLPRDAEAARLYAEALDDLRAFRAEAAREKLERALAREPENPLLHSALAAAWDALGFDDRATEAARAAFERSADLPQEDRLLVEARLREAESDWPAAFEAYRQLFESFPDELDYGLGVVDAQVAGGDAAGALDNVERLRLLPEPLNEDPRIDLAEAEAAARLARLEQQADAAARASQKAEASGASLLLARALLAGAQAERLLGRGESAADAVERALVLYRELDHAPGQAEALTAAANLRFDHGELEAAANGYQEAEAVYREMGDRGGVAASLNNLAVVRKRQGDLDAAEALYRENEAIHREVDDERGTALARNNLAVLLVDRDRLDDAVAMFRESLETFARQGPAARAYSLNNLAEALRLQGRLDDARALHEEAITIRRGADLRRDLAISLANLGLLHVDAGRLDDARAVLEEARDLARASEDPTTRSDVLFAVGELSRREGRTEEASEVHGEALDLRLELEQAARLARSQAAVARLLVDAGRPSEAEDLARLAWTDSRLDGRPADEARAAAVLVEALLALDDPDAAAEIMETSAPIVAETTQPAVTVELGIAEALLLDHRGQRGAADRLAELDRLARSHGLEALAADVRRAADSLGS